MRTHSEFSSSFIPGCLAGKYMGVDQIEIEDFFTLIIAKFPIVMFRRLYFPEIGVTTIVFGFLGMLFNLKLWTSK